MLIFSVSEFNEAVYRHLELLGEVTVEGEITEVRVSQNKWISLTIKDENASLPIFGMIFRISGWKTLEVGMRVQVTGKPRLYQKTGKFSFWADSIVPSGEGALKLAFEKLKMQLEKEGLFDVARKRSIIEFPERIGLITAKKSQAYSDFVKVLQERMGGIKIYFYPVQVQGLDAPSVICEAFEYFNVHEHDLDALVLVRGGGSIEDLHSFNDEHVARAIFSSRIPVICGVGHEDDVTLADLVADQRASTPSNAAELLVREKHAVLSDTLHMTRILVRTFNEEIGNRKSSMYHSLSVLNSVMNRHNRKFHQVLHGFYHGMRHAEQHIRAKKQSIDQQIQSQTTSLIAQHARINQRIDAHVRLLHSLDYKNVLKRGFSITKSADGNILRSADQVKAGNVVATQLARGTIVSEVQEIHHDK